MTQSPFQVGTEVALYRSSFGDRTLKKAVVAQVYKNGAFFTETPDKEFRTRYTPNRNGLPEAHVKSEGFSSHHSWAEVWTEKHDRELNDIRERSALRARLALVQRQVASLRMQTCDDFRVLLNDLEVALKTFSATNDQLTRDRSAT